MLQKLEYSVTFPTSGRTLSEAVLFQGGFGAIVGPNESGKSMILEMVRFCLFGSAALRGRADDYKNLKAELQFRIKGQDYVIQRTSTKATLLEGETPIATGTTPVNLKVIQILGFNLKVFDMACVANQDKLLELGAMGPTDRRKAVDSVIGITIFDDMSKLAGDEATSYKRAADDLAATAREPVAPVAPDGYRPSAELEVEKEALDLVRSRADQLRGWLAVEKPKPVKPEDKIGIGSAILQEYLDAQIQRRIERQTLEAELARIPEAANVTLEEIEEDERREKLHQAYLARRQFLTFHQRPDLTQAQITTLRHTWEAHHRWQKVQHLEQQRKDLLAKGHHECPSCTHQWPIAGDALQAIDDELLTYSKAILLEEKPTTSEAEIDKQQRLLDAWDETEWQKHADSPDKPTEFQWTVQDRVRHRHAIEGRERRAELQTQIEALKPTDKEQDYASMLRERQAYEAQLGVWSDQVAEFEAWEKERGQKMVELAMLDVDLQGYPDLIQALNQARAYEQELVTYQNLLEAYNRVATQVANYRKDAEDWNRVKEALKILRLKIKQYLVPSLNRVASTLITHMTGGERQTVTVDDEFNITVDGQAIDTLSGSGKAVANLALRIGLGQVLTNNVFSLFMGDEIDASMDANRAEKTSGVLQTLKGKISQLLLVSHKFPAADYYIAVGENIDQHLVPN